ncbi:MAG TPA: sarcosine oxidase subunit gamma family protein [Micropepsaceae bacterium]|jgi:sarcosine oxidase subunit gamma|nr:sarcosine oxidase subunit gamma family protein [Micropepsaceae bacterium]
MSDGGLLAQPALIEFGRTERLGKPDGPAGVTVTLRNDLAIASIIARRGMIPALGERVEAMFGMMLPSGPHGVRQENLSILGTGPGRWMFVQDGGTPSFAEALARDLAEFASVSDHSDGYAVFEVSGPFVRQVLAKGVAIDLHHNAFGAGNAAVTAIAHIGAILWQTDDAPHYRIAVFRSSAQSFWHWLSDSARAFGLEYHLYTE